MQLFLQLSKLQGTTSYFDENVGRIGVKSYTVAKILYSIMCIQNLELFRRLAKKGEWKEGA